MLSDFEPLALTPGTIFLDSHYSGREESRFSVMAANPFLLFSARRGLIEITTAEKKEMLQSDPLEVLQQLLERYKTEANEPFGPGAFGYITYEFGYPLQKLEVKPYDDLFLPDLWFAFYDEVSVYDHKLQRKMKHKMKAQLKIEAPDSSKISQVRSQDTASPIEYTKRYQKIMEHIARGNIYQANLCERFVYPWEKDSWEIYKTLRQKQPTAYGAYLNTGRNQILSLSPELFLRKNGSKITTAPIKGTVPQRDKAAVENLFHDEKNRAEHIMIVDLERNDLGRICEWGTIAPEELMHPESCGNVQHMVTTVEGTLRKDVLLPEIFRATFPGGSVTGAPKRKAMEVIGSLEPVVRGLYTGAIGWIGFSGDFVFNLPIRTILVQDQKAYLYLGGGIVSDSSASSEYQEILDKGEPFFEAIGQSNAALSTIA